MDGKEPGQDSPEACPRATPRVAPPCPSLLLFLPLHLLTKHESRGRGGRLIFETLGTRAVFTLGAGSRRLGMPAMEVTK